MGAQKMLRISLHFCPKSDRHFKGKSDRHPEAKSDRHPEIATITGATKDVRVR